MNASTAVAPEKTNAPTINTKHIFHLICNPEGEPHVSYCGMKFKGARMKPWSQTSAKPEDCAMCIEARLSFGCPKCGAKP